MKTTKPRAKKSEKPIYVASIKVLGKIYTSNGSTPREAIESLKVGNTARGMSVMMVSNGKDSSSKVLTSIQTMRLFSQAKLVREIALKNVALMFNA